MRQALIYVSFAIAALSIDGSSTAQAAPWCSTKDGLSCGYYTFQQCLDSIRGVGGNCTQNPHEPPSKSRAAPEQSRAKVREERRAREEQRAKAREETKAREEAKAREEQRRKAAEEQKARQAAPPKQPAAKPAVAAPATPIAPTPPPIVATPVAASAGAMPRKAAPKDARVYFVSLKGGEEITSPVTILFGLSNMGVAPAGLDNANTGHHHLLVDTKLPPLDLPIPNDFNHLHFGAGQSEATVTLPPGKHTLQLLFADENHVPHDPPLMSAPITIVVKAK